MKRSKLFIFTLVFTPCLLSLSMLPQTIVKKNHCLFCKFNLSFIGLFDFLLIPMCLLISFSSTEVKDCSILVLKKLKNVKFL